MRLSFVLISVLFFVTNAFAANVVTVTPIADSMTRALLADTPVSVTYLPPKRLPINRIPSWLSKHRSDPLEAFDAIVNISSMRPELSFYTSIRSGNIHTVPIDIAEALLPGGERVAVQEPDEYFWLNSNNALLMLGILKRDLSLLWPEYASKIAYQHQILGQTLRQITLDIDDVLLESNYEAIVNRNKSTQPFTKGLLLPVFTEQDSIDLASLNILIISGQGKSNQWMVDDFSRYSDTGFIDRWKSTLNNLKALK
ncbi:hypothetical protein ACMUMQ_11660 [Marinomonas sp. 2405UD66-6]|uniref:hypothetical protein n=1 Tax=Marinomonas sp. 2405UD66-6 TaxID=3391834 RepID=UPI0039C9B202